MIASPKPPSTLPCRTLGLLLLLAGALLLPAPGRAAEPDYEGVGARIQASVEAGEITPGQGRAMMDALREHVARAEEEAFAGELRTRLWKEVLAGSGTEEGAASEYRRVLGERLRRAVRDGAVTEQEAAERRRAWTEGRETALSPSEQALFVELRRGVEAGGLTPEEAGAEWEEAMADLERYRYEQALRLRFREAVQAGRMTEEEARAGYRKVMDAWLAREPRDR